MKKLAWIFAWLTIGLPLHAASLEDLSNKKVFGILQK